MNDPEAEIAVLRAELESLKTQVSALERTAIDAANNVGGGPDMGLPIVPIGGAAQGTFRFEGTKITHCTFYAAHQAWSLQDKSLGEDPSGTWFLNVPHATPEGATISTTAGANDDNNTSIPLFTIEGGQITKDYRGMPFVPIYA